MPATAANAPGSPIFALHTLGWRAFQDLCAAILRHVWGQSFQQFADSNDGGRDGAFHGVWQDLESYSPVRDAPPGPFVLQCKHTKNDDSTLTPGEMSEEFSKVKSLVDRGLCRTYVLMTNARVTGASESAIRQRLREAGVEHPLILAGHWICETIALNKTLRLYVPRVYGLGDLSQILDERAYAQTEELMASASDQVAKFVLTAPYRKAARALEEHGFVLLLGEPAVGKSVIALMLAIAAADSWGCLTVKARTSNDLVKRWNPHEREQFFWIDDAFGSVRHEESLTYDWSRNMQHVMTAIKNGARVVLTSRGYIYNDARPLLKEYAYPLLREQQVTVNVEDLTQQDREQILYNHISMGDQPVDVKRRLKPLLPAAAAVQPFRPEAARRLGSTSFTANLAINPAGITAFMSAPRQMLRDVFDQLGPDAHAALAVVYAAGSGGVVREPWDFTPVQLEIIARVGGTRAGTARALRSLTGDFLSSSADRSGRAGVTFRHPTLWEGFASWLQTHPHLISLVLAGLSLDDLFTRIDCNSMSSAQPEGVLVRVPPTLYPEVVVRLRRAVSYALEYRGCGYSSFTGSWRAAVTFLSYRCSDEFLHIYIEQDPDLLPSLAELTSYVSSLPEPMLLARFHKAGLLDESLRRRAVDRLTNLAVETPDASWLDTYEWSVLLTAKERSDLLDSVRDELVPALKEFVRGWVDAASGYDIEDPLSRQLSIYSQGFGAMGDTDTARAFSEAEELYTELMDERHPIEPDDEYDYRPRPRAFDHEPVAAEELRRPTAAPVVRSTFDDVDL